METGFDRAIVAEMTVPASLEAVWQAWTTEDGVCTFFAPRARIELRPGGAYEMFFALDAPSGRQGGEGITERLCRFHNCKLPRRAFITLHIV